MTPIRRDLHFPLPADRLGTWHPDGAHVSQFFNTLSTFFPEGERFFIHSVRNYRDRVTDPELQKDVTGFIGQEAMHGREHEHLNRALTAAGLPLDRQEKFVTWLLENGKRLPRPLQLSITVALEHMTATLADYLLRNPHVLEQAEPAFAAMWNWHALEETEHKAVAYDVYQAVMPKSAGTYAIRAGGMVGTQVIFWACVTVFYVQNARAAGIAGNVRGWMTLVDHLFLRKGVLRKSVLPLLAYFRPGFHPWDQDNRAFLKAIPALEKRYGVEMAQAA